MNDDLTDIGRELFRLLTECRSQWALSRHGWLEHNQSSVSLRAVGGDVLLFVGGNVNSSLSNTADKLALVPVIESLTSDLQQDARSGDLVAVRAALGLNGEAK